MTKSLPEFWVSKSRLETLFDGVFAIAMTLMVLEIKIPELADRGSMEEFATAMRHNVPNVVAFLLSMGMLGLFWYRHHRQYHYIARITPGLLAINLGFLSAVSFFPFSAGVLGRYPMNFGVYFVYLPNTLLLVALLSAQWVHARRHGLLVAELAPEAARRVHLENMLGLGTVAGVAALYLGGIAAIRHYGLGREYLSYVGLLVLPLAIAAKVMRRRLRRNDDLRAG
ncbi:MAG: TMEM175 family protein [Acidobacteriota bacterium]